MDDVSDVQRINFQNGEKLESNFIGNNNVLDIQRITFYEKSNYLNATAWLGGNPQLIPQLENISKWHLEFLLMVIGIQQLVGGSGLSIRTLMD